MDSNKMIWSRYLSLMINGEQLERKNLQWYDLIQCYYYSNYMPTNFVECYIPVMVLKQYQILPENMGINLGDERQYKINFKEFFKNGKNIDMIFDEYIKDKKIFSYKELFLFVKFLYRKQYSIDEYGKPREQGEVQFRKEFNRFIKELNYTWALKDKNGLNYIKDLLKIFILFRSMKIKKFDIPLDCNREYLSEQAVVINNLEKVFEDHGSVAPFDGLFNSRNSVILMKLYTLLLINLDFSIDDIDKILKYEMLINIYEKAYFSPDDSYFNHGNNKEQIEYISKDREKFIDDCIGQFKCDLALKKMSISMYYVLKLYINNKIKVLKWKEISLGILEKEDVSITDLDNDKLYKLYNITKDIVIKDKADIFKALNGRATNLNANQLDFIYDIIFQDDNSRKDKKREKLKNSFEKINIITYEYIKKTMISRDKINSNILYDFIISAKLYFEICNTELDEVKITNKSLSVNDRNKSIEGRYYQITKKILTEKNYNEWCKDNSPLVNEIDSVYLQVPENIFARYFYLYDFNNKCRLNNQFVDIQKIVLNHFKKFYEALLNEFFNSTLRK